MGGLADYLVQHDGNFRKARIPALYSDFRPQRTLNPDGYRANISAWRGALARLASRGLLSRHGGNPGILVLDLDESLRRSLETKQFGQPLALGTAAREAVADRDLVPLQHFMQLPQSIYQRGWSEVPWSVVGWTLRQLGVVDPARGDDKLPSGRYVVMDNVEAASKELNDRMQDMTSRFDRVFTKAEFDKTFAGELIENQRLSETDLDVLLKFLARDKGLIEYDGQTIRLRGTGEQQDGITDEDTAMASIKELTANLRHQTALLDSRISELEVEAKRAVSRKNRVTALASLKAKKLAESSLSKRYATLNQLEEVAAKMEQASDQVQLVKVMESSAGVLKDLNARVGGADRVDDVMDQLRQQMSETDEVAAIMAESGTAVDEGELDDELEAMEAQERQREEEAQRQKEEAHRKEEEAREGKEAAEVTKKMDELPHVPTEAIPDREKAQTPTSETGIAHLSIEG